MVVTTRSKRSESHSIDNTQIQNKVIVRKIVSTQPIINEPAAVSGFSENINPSINPSNHSVINFKWFSTNIKEKIKMCDDLHKLALLNLYDIRVIKYDIIRVITDVMQFVNVYLPRLIEKPNIIKFVKTVLYKSMELKKQGEMYFQTIAGKPITSYDLKCMKSFNFAINEATKCATLLLSNTTDVKQYCNFIGKKPNAENVTKRNRKIVDFTGMDTIEPESEYDGITDIWADNTIYTDPDYYPSEDEYDEDDSWF